jgi:hypothetical protein
MKSSDLNAPESWADLQQCLVLVLRTKGPREALVLYDELLVDGLAPANLTPWPEIREMLAAPDENAREKIRMRLNVIVREAVDLAMAFEPIKQIPEPDDESDPSAVRR